MDTEGFRYLQACLNTNMETFASRYEIPTFYDPALFGGWRIAEVGSVSKLLWQREARVHGLALLTLWCDAPLHHLPCVEPYTLDREVMRRVDAALLPRHSRHTLYVDARHIQTMAIRRGHGAILALIGAGSSDLLFLAGTFLRHEQQRHHESEDDLLNTDWE
jgi:hypothetical protein